MLEVACIKWGDKYGAEYVNKLSRAVNRNMSIPHTFACYTDDPGGVEAQCAPLPGDISGWWNKLYLFAMNKNILLIDLDVVITGDIDCLVTDNFTAIKDPWQSGYNSSIVRIVPFMTDVWESFLALRPDINRSMHGDQDWLNSVPGFAVESCYGAGMCKSYKAEVRPHGVGDARAVYFHGSPKPHQVRDEFVLRHWI